MGFTFDRGRVWWALDMNDRMRLEQMDRSAAATWLRMAFIASNPGVEAEDDWGIELPMEAASEPIPEDDWLSLRTRSY